MAHRQDRGRGRPASFAAAAAAIVGRGAAVVFARWKNQLNFMQMSAGCEGGREGGRKEGAEKRGKRDKIQVGIVDKFVLSYFEIFIRQTKWVEDMLTTEF